MARTYKRDANGRFASGGGTRSGRPAAKPVSRGRNRLTRDNAGKITSVGGEGATARGGRLRTAAGNKRATQVARIKGAGGKLRKPVVSGKPKPTGISTIPAGDLKRYRMLENKIGPLRKALDRDGSTMMGSTDYKRRNDAAARYDLNNRRLKRVTDTMRKLSNSPNSPNIPRLPQVTESGRRIGRIAAIKKMDGPRKFGGQSWRDLRGRYSQGKVQYEDNYMNKLYKRDKGQGIKQMPKAKGTISRPKNKTKSNAQAPMQPQPAGSRTRKQAATGYRQRANKTAMKALRARTITESEKRIVVGRSKATQMNIWGRAEKVGTGKLRLIGERGRTGRLIKNKPNRTPGPGSPRAKRYRADAIKAARELGAAGLFRDRGR